MEAPATRPTRSSSRWATCRRQIEELPLGDGPLAVVCRSGNRSGRVVAWLSQQGIDAVNVAGGMQAWDAAGKPMVAEGSGPAQVI